MVAPTGEDKPSVGYSLDERPFDQSLPIHPLRDLVRDRVVVLPAEVLPYTNPLVYSNADETCNEDVRRALGEAAALPCASCQAVFIGRYPPGALVLGADSFWVLTGQSLVAEQIIPFFAPQLLPFFEPDPAAKLAALRATITDTADIVEESVLLVRYGCGVWGHWLNEILPKAVVAEAVFPGRFHYVVSGTLTRRGGARDPADAILESLAAYGISESRLIRIEPRRNYRFHSLFDVGGCSMWNIVHPGVASWMRDRLGNVAPKKDFALLGIDRQGSTRVLQNMAQIKTDLVARGFGFINSSLLPFQEQVAYFRGASMIFSIYGSGLAGILYAPEGIRVLACAPANWVDTYYLPIVKERRGLYAEVRGAAALDGVDHVSEASFRVDPKDVAMALQRLHVAGPALLVSPGAR